MQTEYVLIVKGKLYALNPSKCECFLTGGYQENHWVGSNRKIPNSRFETQNIIIVPGTKRNLFPFRGPLLCHVHSK